MKNTHNKSKPETLRQKAEALLKNKSETKILDLIEELAFQNEEKEKRAAELIIANKELALQRDNLKKIASQLPGLVYQYLQRPDGTSCFPYASEAIRDIYRISPDEVREDASKVFAIGHPDDFAGVVASIRESAQNLTPWQHEYRVKFVDGTIRSLYGNAVPQKEADGSVLWHGFITDITEENRLKEELKSSEEQRISVLNNITDVVWSLSWPDLKVKFISQSVEQIFGRSVQEFVENPSLWEKMVHPDDKHISDKAFEQLAKEGSAVRECRIVRPDGSIVWINDKSKIIADQNDKPLRIDGVSRDITERKLVEDELRIKEERYRLLAENTRDVVYTMNLDGTITYVSPAVELLRGLTVEEAMNQPLDKILTPDSQAISIGYVQQLCAAIESGSPLPMFHGELEYYRKDMSTLMTESYTYPVPGIDGRSITMLGVTRDITERKKAETALFKAKEDAEVANKAKSTFLANMSHEIRTPLNAIIGFSQLMNREKLLTDTQKEYNTTIYRAGEHLLKLINDILELSKIEAGRAELKPENFDLHALLNDILMMFKEQALSKQLKLIVETSGDLPHHVIADDHKLRQILINLIGNAIKFTDLGSIVVRARIDNWHKETSCLIIEIQDSGPGMSEDELGKLFRQFEQTTAGINSARGTGLGLALSRELAILMGGNITVTSEAGKGSVFTINVEIKVGEPEVREASVTKRVTGIDNPKDVYRVLVVDDKKENRDVMGSFLRMVGFETTEAVDGKDAIAKFEQWNPHLILMDMRMPVMDGYEATRRIKSTEKGKQTPIIAVTASSLEDEKKNVLKLDIQGYIPKPFHENELFETIGRVLGINYLYEEETTANALSRYLNNDEIVDEDIAKLPEEVVLQMKHAVETADFHLLTAYIERIEKDYPELSRHLMAQATDFNYVYLLQVLKKRKNER